MHGADRKADHAVGQRRETHGSLQEQIGDHAAEEPDYGAAFGPAQQTGGDGQKDHGVGTHDPEPHLREQRRLQ